MPETAPPVAKSSGHSALERGLALLECFGPDSRSLSHGEMARRTGIPKPTVTRLIATLVGTGYLKPSARTDHYELSARTVTLARSFLRGLDIRTSVRPHLDELAQKTNASSFLAVRDRSDMVLIDVMRSRTAPVVLQLDVGSRLSLTESALGRAWLAALGRDALARVFAQLGAADDLPPPDVDGELAASLNKVRETGYCISIGDWHAEINTVAIPLRSARGELMSINCGGPASAFPEHHIRSFILPHLLETGSRIAEEIAGSSADTAIQFIE